MLTLLGSILGFFSSIVPTILKMWQDRKDKEHELALMEKQLEVQLKLGRQKLEAQDMQMDMETLKMAYQFADSSKWKDKDIGKIAKTIIYFITSSVRPIVTYIFLCGYLYFKYNQMLVLKDFSMVWSEEDTALFAAIISFWFGNRSIEKIRKGI